MSNKNSMKTGVVQETLIIPLYARKSCTEVYPNLFQDRMSVEIVKNLDYDFSVIEKKIDSYMGRFGALEIAMRQSDLASEVKSYLADHPSAAIVNLGCGLDCTAENCAGTQNKIYNLDFEDVIAARNQLIPPTNQTRNIAVNLNDVEWFDKIDSESGVVFAAAGLFYYFRKDEIRKLFTAMEKRFPGSVLVFDTANKRGVKAMIRTWVKQVGIQDVDAFFHVNDIRDDLTGWLNQSEISSRGYMLGYNDLRDRSIRASYRWLARVGDGMMGMKIVKILFGSK